MAQTWRTPKLPKQDFSGMEPKIGDFIKRLLVALDVDGRDIRQLINSGIDLGNFKCYTTTVSDTGAADSENTVNHNLGYTPTFYFYNVSLKGYLYDSRRSSWSTTQMFFKCSVANASVVLYVL